LGKLGGDEAIRGMKSFLRQRVPPNTYKHKSSP
jgi:hypothetical protein